MICSLIDGATTNHIAELQPWVTMIMVYILEAMFLRTLPGGLNRILDENRTSESYTGNEKAAARQPGKGQVDGSAHLLMFPLPFKREEL